MSLKHPYIFYWLISVFCCLLTVLGIFFFHGQFGQNTDLLKPIDVTTHVDVEPGRYYQTKGRFRLDIRGISSMKLPIKNLPININDYNMFVINNLEGFRSASIYLTAQLTTAQNQAPVHYSQKLISNRQSVNELYPEWIKAESVSKVTLVIEPEISLGFAGPSDDEISWQSMQFTNDKHINPIQQLVGEVFAFVPLNYSSVNVNNMEAIAIYKSMLIALGVWLFISVGLFFIIKPSVNHLFIHIALAWFSATVIYGYNFRQQIQFNQHRFAEHNPYLNVIDSRLSTIAKRINERIIQQNNEMTPKVMIMGGDDFSRKRLNFHLLQFNVGVIGDYQEVLNSLERPNHYAVLLPPHNEICQQEQQQTHIKPDILLKTTQFCLIR